jgi:hypothetical protein
MIRDDVVLWASIGLTVILAFVLVPSYERFRDKDGKYVDVAPNAPPPPKRLIPISGRTGERTEFAPPSGSLELYPIPDIPPSSQPEVDLPQSTTVTALPPPVTVDSDVPSGVRTLPSQSMPPNPLLGTSPSLGPVKNTINRTLPPPDFSPGGYSEQQNRYVLKSSLVPCTCGSQGMSCPQHAGSYPSSTVPGALNEDEEIKKPFSVAFAGETNPVGYLNSFAAFSK